MRKLLLGLLFSLNNMPIAYADEQLPEIVPVDEPAFPPLDAQAS